MTKVRIFKVLIIFLVVSTAHLAEAGQESLLISLETGETGEKLKVSDINWPDWIDSKIRLVNDGAGEFFVEVSNDATEWQVVNWLESQDKTGLENFHRLDMTLDGALNTARMQNVIRLMKDKGLERLALRHIPVRAETVYIKIYYQAVGAQPVLYHSETNDQAVQESLDRLYELIRLKAEEFRPSVWAVTVGLGISAVQDGSPITTPEVSVLRLKGKYILAVTGGFWSKNNLDQKRASMWLAYFPKNPYLGLMVQASYNSEVISNGNGYIQQGYGPMLGLIFKDKKLSIHLTGGFQYFDRLEQDRRLEPTINLGVNFGVLSF